MQGHKVKTTQHCDAQEQIESLKSAIRHNEQAIDDMRSMVTALEKCLRPENKKNIIQLDSSAESEPENNSQSA